MMEEMRRQQQNNPNGGQGGPNAGGKKPIKDQIEAFKNEQVHEPNDQFKTSTKTKMTVTITKEVTTSYVLPDGQKQTKTITLSKEIPIDDADCNKP